jgi:hypothetical protein
MIEYALREGSTEPIDFDLGEIDPGSRVISAVDLQTVSEIVLYCRAKRSKATVKSFTKTGSEISVIQDDNGDYRRLRVLPGVKLLFLDNEYSCYFKITDGAGSITSWPEGDATNPHFIIKMLEKFA